MHGPCILLGVCSERGHAFQRVLSPKQRIRPSSAAGRAKISKLTKERWAKFRAEKGKKAK